MTILFLTVMQFFFQFIIFRSFEALWWSQTQKQGRLYNDDNNSSTCLLNDSVIL